MSKITGWVQVIEVPDLEGIPFWVRQELVGLIFPCCADVDCPEKSARYGVAVPHLETLTILGQHINNSAKEWFDQHGYPKSPPEDYFFLAENQVSSISCIDLECVLPAEKLF